MVEYCENGDLYKYLKKHRNEAKWVGDPDGGTTIEYISRIRIAFDIANGMSYLSTKGVSTKQDQVKGGWGVCGWTAARGPQKIVHKIF